MLNLWDIFSSSIRMVTDGPTYLRTAVPGAPSKWFIAPKIAFTSVSFSACLRKWNLYVRQKLLLQLRNLMECVVSSLTLSSRPHTTSLNRFLNHALPRNQPTNQPTNQKATKGGVLCKRETSSLARFDHSCVRNALLEMENGALKL
jgi:hypothetical protein